MREKKKRKRARKSIILLIIFIMVFAVLGTVVFSVTSRISREMSASAIDNLSESLKLIKNTIETILHKEAEFQKLLAKEIVNSGDLDEFLLSCEDNDTMVKISLIRSGETEGITSRGEEFSEEGLDFSAGKTVDGLPISKSYVNSMGTWAYTMKCPITEDGEEIATLYIEYIYDSLDEALPDKFYNKSAKLYIMDAYSERLVLKPKGIGERDAGHLNLEDFYHANKILEEDVQNHINESVRTGQNVMFYHEIQNKDSLIYMWGVNQGTLYLIGYVPIEAIQREGDAVNQNMFIVVAVMLCAFLGCCVGYFLYEKQQRKIRAEREAEREVHNKQLTEALQTAQIANNSKTMFLSNMSHDIRTPMNAILGFATLLAKDAQDPDKVKEYTKKITASGQHLLSLINDVLDISKIESGKVVLTIGEFALNDMISSVDAIIRPAAKAKGQKFSISVTGIKHERLIGDETRINQILINLLSNAVKYTQEGGSIWLRFIGMNQHSNQYEHIRIEVEGGTIAVVSEMDQGSLFTVDLELRIPDVEADEQFWEQNGVARILVVDAEEDVCTGIQMLMEKTGVQVEIAQNGEAALGMLEQASDQGEEYQVILVDWNIPGMKGIETARRMRKVLPEHTPILLLSAFDWEEIREEALEAGISGFLAKPFFVSAFKEKLMELLAEQSDKGEYEKLCEEGGLEGRRFLVAEDNEINAEILSELLDIEEAVCEIVENGKLAVERFNETEPGSYDAILMDVQMPVMNGYEAARAIRALERDDAKLIPIIAMTANAFAEDVKDAMDAGMDAHIAKPIDMLVLKRTLSLYLARDDA